MKMKALTIGFFAVDAVLIGIGAFLYMNQDKTAPVIMLPEKAIVYENGMAEEKLLEGITAYDAEDGDVTDSLLVEKISEAADGRVIVTYAAVDSANHVTQKSRILEVKTSGESRKE